MLVRLFSKILNKGANMSSVTATGIVTVFHLAGGDEKFSTEEANELKWKYIEQLIDPVNINKWDNSIPSQSEFKSFLSERPLEILQKLFLALGDIFRITPACTNDCRMSIVKYLLGAPQNDWKLVLKQVCSIMPHGTEGKDIALATGVLASIDNSTYREQLVNVALRLYKYDTLSIERYYILNALTKYNSEELSQFDKADKETREAFVEKEVPEYLKKGAVTVATFDTILQKGWKV